MRLVAYTLHTPMQLSLCCHCKQHELVVGLHIVTSMPLFDTHYTSKLTCYVGFLSFNVLLRFVLSCFNQNTSLYFEQGKQQQDSDDVTDG